MAGNHGCILTVLRIQNGFSRLKNYDINNILNNMDKLEYCDLKVNVLVDFNNIRLVGEIQFVLSWMIHVKKSRHKLDEFARKQAYYNQMNKMAVASSSRDESLKSGINYIIVTQNYDRLSNLLLYFDSNEKDFMLNNQKYIRKLMVDSQWSKGVKLFDCTISSMVE